MKTGQHASGSVISVDHVSKKFCRDLRRSLWYGLQSVGCELVGRQVPLPLRPKEFWALQDVSFDLHPGDCLGVVGTNGGGKSTILKLLTGLLKPNAGQITVRGRVGSLIELGAGFNPVLTGRENIYVNASILGLRGAEVDQHLNNIINFSGVKEAIDAPVASYSSGMRVRLGFAIASHLKPDILLVDEVLAVGDLAFREKSYQRIRRLHEDGAALVLVSHSPHAILSVCDRVLWVDRGRVQMLGSAGEVMRAYLDAQEERILAEERVSLDKKSDGLFGRLSILGIDLLGPDGVERSRFTSNDPVHVRIRYEATEPVPDAHFRINICARGGIVFNADMLSEGCDPPILKGQGFLECVFPDARLVPGSYNVLVTVFGSSASIKLVRLKSAMFRVTDVRDLSSDGSVLRHDTHGVVIMNHEWRW